MKKLGLESTSSTKATTEMLTKFCIGSEHLKVSCDLELIVIDRLKNMTPEYSVIESFPWVPDLIL